MLRSSVRKSSIVPRTPPLSSGSGLPKEGDGDRRTLVHSPGRRTLFPWAEKGGHHDGTRVSGDLRDDRVSLQKPQPSPKQAFLRKSYAQENPGTESNEVLEFFGDKVLDYVIVRSMSTPEWYGSLTPKGQFRSRFDEGKLTVIKRNLVEKGMLAKRIDILDLARYLAMGKGDLKNHVEEDASVKEDLFEAILGAVALDSGWDEKVLRDVVFKMLDPVSYLNQGYDKDFNYCGRLQERCQKKGVPLAFRYEEIRATNLANTVLLILDNALRGSALTGYRCRVDLFGKTFCAEGRSKAQARMNVSKLALEDAETLRRLEEDEEEGGEQNPVQSLHTLFQKGVVGQPCYQFEEKRDKAGKPYWGAKLSIPGCEIYFYGDFSSKREAKRKLASAMLKKLSKAEGEKPSSEDGRVEPLTGGLAELVQRLL